MNEWLGLGFGVYESLKDIHYVTAKIYSSKASSSHISSISKAFSSFRSLGIDVGSAKWQRSILLRQVIQLYRELQENRSLIVISQLRNSQGVVNMPYVVVGSHS